ncbi:Indole-3-glycerol phosphate synthase [Candidatus Syntrophocurvum alkaliphilum]|uniref:indole-3-glycerol-phosphate synthase n=1 Tax=Candidatus Syntrophocurvum alkaliphilum TaxID=2293317 RepID=A0A6I6DLT4_9FIRM|nr:indole-3-glycerol phosphate synthase TrpC [Candidatus Syntrophocurvum alkaliphilum]QGU00092.1 Indole-3-glycerol phosphate synthase [Candidatus Syntrophocurvum alkaliphilum]
MLDSIINIKREEIKLLKKELKIEKYFPGLDNRKFLDSLKRENGVISVIAEVKKASPVKGVLCNQFDPVELADIYEKNGATAISVITDNKYFLGEKEYLSLVKKTVDVPILRKDFIIDELQLYETAVLGADAVLLISRILDYNVLLNLVEKCFKLGVEPFVEVHDRADINKCLDTPVKVIGINNRNLKDFTVSIDSTLELIEYIPNSIVKVSESGIKSQRDLVLLEKAGVNAVLVGESIVVADNIPAKVKELAYYREA